MQLWGENVTDSEIHSALVRWLKNATGLTTIKGEQSGPAPSHPYCMVNMTGVAEVRIHPQNIIWERHEDAEEGESQRSTATPVIETEWRFSVHVYGDDPTTYLRKLRSHVHLAQANEPLMPGLIIHEISQVRDVPDFNNVSWEPRAQMDLYLRGLTKDGVLVDTIETYRLEISWAD